jgi:hypothetical protein
MNQSPWRVVVRNPIHETWVVRSFRRREAAERFFKHSRRRHRLGDWVELELQSGGRWVRAQLRGPS